LGAKPQYNRQVQDGDDVNGQEGDGYDKHNPMIMAKLADRNKADSYQPADEECR
jgi:hypothetical protein